MNVSRWIKGVSLIAALLSGFNVMAAEISPEKVKRLLGEMKSDNDELAQVATLELAGYGEEALSLIDSILKSPGEHDRDFEAYREIIGVIRKSTPITLHEQKANALDVLKSISKQACIGIQSSSASLEAQLARQEISLDVEKMPFWELMDIFAQQADLRVSADMVLNTQGYNPPGSKLAGDWVFLYEASTDKKVDYLSKKNQATALKLTLRVYLDPLRQQCLNRSEIRIDQAIDDAGNIYTLPRDSADLLAPFRSGVVTVNTSFRSDPVFSVTLNTPANAGKSLSIRGATTYYGGPAETKSIEIDGIEGKTLDVGAGKVTISKITDASGLTATFLFRPDDWRITSSVPIANQISPLAPNCIWAEDDQGLKRKLSVSSMTNAQNQITLVMRLAQTAARGAPAVKISRLVFRFPNDLAPISIPFEIKNIPLP